MEVNGMKVSVCMSVCTSRVLAPFKPQNLHELPRLSGRAALLHFYQTHRIQSISSHVTTTERKNSFQCSSGKCKPDALRDITIHSLINLNCFMYSLLQIGVTVRWTFPVPKIKPLADLIGIQHETSNTLKSGFIEVLNF